MKAYIICGGKGTRLLEKFNVPKALVSIANKPIIQWQIERLRDNKIKDITLVVGFMHEQIEKFCGNGKQFGVKISYYYETEPMGTFGELSEHYKELPKYFYYVLGDIMFNIDPNIIDHEETCIAVHEAKHPKDSTLVYLNNINGRIVKYYSKGEWTKWPKGINPMLNSAGVIFFKKDELMNLGKKVVDVDEDILKPMINANKVLGCNFDERFAPHNYIKDMGTPERWKEVDTYVRNNITAF